MRAIGLRNSEYGFPNANYSANANQALKAKKRTE